jgi:hypothetical protein
MDDIGREDETVNTCFAIEIGKGYELLGTRLPAGEYCRESDRGRG